MLNPNYHIFQDSSAYSHPFPCTHFTLGMLLNSTQFLSCDMISSECNESLSLHNQLQNENLKVLALFSHGGNVMGYLK